MRKSQMFKFDPPLDLDTSSSRDSDEGNMNDQRRKIDGFSVPGKESRLIRSIKAGINSSPTGAVTFEWLRQAEDARIHGSSDGIRSVAARASGRDSPSNGVPPLSTSVIQEFYFWRRKPEVAEAVAAIKALTAVIRRSDASTMMGLEIELKAASEALKAWDETSISLSAGCDLFMRYVTRTAALEFEDIRAGRNRLIERGERFGEISMKSKQTISNLGQEFIHDNSTVLTHGYSRVVVSLLKLAAHYGRRFSVLCTEGRLDNSGVEMVRELSESKIPVKLILDAGVAYNMEKVDMVLMGAEGVVESGGIISNIGTYQTALVANSMNKPVYIAAESYKFARLYPLSQDDMSPAPRTVDLGSPVPTGMKIETAARDYTPPEYLTLLFTDLGILTPSAVSDELIQLYL